MTGWGRFQIMVSVAYRLQLPQVSKSVFLQNQDGVDLLVRCFRTVIQPMEPIGLRTCHHRTTCYQWRGRQLRHQYREGF